MISTESLYTIYLQHPRIYTDSRKLSTGDLFFALKGDNFNGNRFAAEALEKGAAYAVVDENPVQPNDRLLVVPDVLKSLQDLAAHHRSRFSIPFIAITGSNGKTTTKELVHAVLSTSYRTYTTEGNLNNHIGIPLTILKIKSDAELAVIEMGANHIGEIAGYCRYARPTHGIITNIGKAHLEGFGGIAGVRKGKGELYDWLRGQSGTAFVMWGYADLREMSEGIREVISYGTKEAWLTGVAEDAPGDSEKHLRVRLTSCSPEIIIQTHLTGKYNLPNVLAAAAVGTYFKIEPAKIRASIEAYQPSNSRSQIVQQGSNTIVLDAYNANPSSMKAAIENFAGFPAKEKILVLGAMMELGPGSLQEHEEIVKLISSYPWKDVLLVGGDFLKIKHPYRSFANSTAAGEWLKSAGLTNTSLLVKGSRSMAMEKVVSHLSSVVY
ncbi:MAG TPA: UDP-N-acetylmuramoyl-tripeptide--D-alanyl-D-alanine ligase [Puia sp.]|nr:UDP-N-acetylmuramoyl-tripeptide--D-alanyl-D-alanine ligase [Puia sp.]